MSLEIVAWVAIGGRSYKSLHLDQHAAVDAAARHHGVFKGLVLLEDVERALTEAYNDGVRAGRELKEAQDGNHGSS